MRPSLKRRRVVPSSRVHGVSSDIGQVKKVKFADSADLHEQNCRQHASSPQLERTCAPSSNVSKTTEYKFFKKLWEEAGRKIPTCQHHQQGTNLESLEEGGCVEEFRITDNSDLSNFLVPLQKVTPIIQRSYISSDKGSQHSGPSEKHRGIFQKKKENLLQIAAETLSLGVEELKYKQSEVISDLLHRLGLGRKPKRIQWDHDALPKLLEKKSDGRFQSLASVESDGFVEDLIDNAERDLLTGIRSLTNNSLAIRCHEADNFIVSPLDSVDNKAFPPSYTPKLTRHSYDASMFDAHLDEFPESACRGLVDIAATRFFGYQSLARNSSEAPESIILHPGNFLQDFPNLTASKASLLCCGSQSRWLSDSEGLSYTANHLLSEFSHPMPNSTPPVFQFTEQELVPCINSTSRTPLNLHSLDSHWQTEKQQCSLPLLQWEEEGEEDLEFSAPPPPLVPYSVPNILDQIQGCWFGHGYERMISIETSPVSKSWDFTIQDGSNLLMDDALLQSPRLVESKPEWNDILTSSRGQLCLSPIRTGLDLLDTTTEGTLGSMSPVNMYQFSIDTPYSYRLLTDRIYWHQEDH